MAKDQVKNEVFLDDDDILHVVYHGDLDRPAAADVHKRAGAIITDLMQAGKGVYVLLDTRDLGKHDPTVRWMGRDKSAGFDIRAVALLMNDSDAYTAKIIEIAKDRSPHKDKMMYFKSEADAVQWLKEALSNAR